MTRNIIDWDFLCKRSEIPFVKIGVNCPVGSFLILF